MLGANGALAISLAAARAAAAAQGVPFYLYVAALAGVKPLLPLPMVNMISGGAHAGHNLDIQDVLAMPIGAFSYLEGLEMLVRLYWALRSLLLEAGHPPLVGDEGGFGPALAGNEEALALVIQAIERAGLRPGSDMVLALDVAATGFHREGAYHLQRQLLPEILDAAGMVAMIGGWVDRYPVQSVEDALAEDDWAGWQVLTARLGSRVQLVGDDLFTTSAERLQRGIDLGAANAVLVKVNQAGTLSGALATLRLARRAGYRAVVSARSGETEDDWLADLAVGSGAGQIKVGSIARSERLAKYNRLLRIEEELGQDGHYAGGTTLIPRA
jgi:enolase